MSELVLPKPKIWVPHIWIPRDYGIPPSPPAEQRARRRKAILKAVRSYTGRFPEGWSFSRIGTPGAMEGGMQSLTGVETGLYGSNQTPLAAATVFSYSLENTSWLDNTVNANTLTPSSSAPTITTGKVGNAARFTATGFPGTQWLTCAFNTAFNLGAGGANGWATTCWVYIVSDIGNEMLYGQGLTWRWMWNHTATTLTLTYSYNDGGQVTSNVTSTDTAAVGAWVFLYGYVRIPSLNNTIVGIKVNNGTAAEGLNRGFPLYSDTSTGFEAGGHVSGGQGFNPLNGLIDEVNGWKRVLTQTEQDTLYNSGNGVAWGSW